MKLAICAPFMESDLWQERLRRAAPWAALEPVPHSSWPSIHTAISSAICSTIKFTTEKAPLFSTL